MLPGTIIQDIRTHSPVVPLVHARRLSKPRCQHQVSIMSIVMPNTKRYLVLYSTEVSQTEKITIKNSVIGRQ